MFYNNYYNFSTILILILIYIILSKINVDNKVNKEENKKEINNEKEINIDTNLDKKYDFICISFENQDIEDILGCVVDKYYMNGLLIGKFNFNKRDYIKHIEIDKNQFDSNKALKGYLQSRIYLKIGEDIIKNINIPILNSIDIEENIKNIIFNYKDLKTK